MTITRYLVTVDTPAGRAELEVPSTLGPEAAGRRAFWAAAAQRWGDLGEITVTSICEISDDEECE